MASSPITPRQTDGETMETVRDFIWGGSKITEKTLMLGKIEDRRRRGWRRMKWLGWHHGLNGHEFEQAPGVGAGQGSLACCSPWGRRVRHGGVTELNWLNYLGPWTAGKVLQVWKHESSARKDEDLWSSAWGKHKRSFQLPVASFMHRKPPSPRHWVVMKRSQPLKPHWPVWIMALHLLTGLYGQAIYFSWGSTSPVCKNIMVIPKSQEYPED